jgi:hypothetical protein
MHLKKQNFGKMNKNKIRKIEKLIGRNWWLGHQIWERIYNMRGDFDPNFYHYYNTIPLRKFNVRRSKRGFSMISPTKRRFEFSRILKNN